MFTDFVINGAGTGEVGNLLTDMSFNTGLLKPFFDDRPKLKNGNSNPFYGKRCVTINVGGNGWDNDRKAFTPRRQQFLISELQQRGVSSPVFNATTLRKEEMIHLDQVVLRAARYRLRAWADLAAANSFGGFNAMGKMMLEHETMTDPGEAVVDMDGLTEGRTDAPKFQLEGLPLPITHSDFWFSSRRLAISRNTGTPLDTTMGEAAGRRVAELIEKTTIGNNTGVTYSATTQSGGYGRTAAVYGYTNFPARITSTALTKPTTGGWVASTLVSEVLAIRDTLYLNKFYGPFIIYHSNDWDRYLDGDYILTGGNVATQTLRERLRWNPNTGKGIEGITDVRRLDFLFATPPQTNQMWTTTTVAQGGSGSGLTGITPYKGPGGEGISSSGNPFRLIFVQMTPDVARAVNGMDITTVQWESVGGMRLNFKVMAIQVAQLRADFYGNAGILDATGQ